MNVFETTANELRELGDLVRRTTEWDMSVAYGRVKLEEVPPERARPTLPSLAESREVNDLA
ncbi:hypothetical protein WS98_21890 [Burkholderia territorii]|uniref:hypothetical protein n=1 Tax=Burkholderia territorii TaxID=1503055 RepID=UPI000759C48A|nr:hypothetical protein [Burkholderia territorii]KVL32191.1 hypothetical protein WS98_21890 [Burkholderia territorii]